MIQIAYHPAYDTFHTTFRVLRILSCIPEETIKVDKLKILDFYMAFPRLTTDITGLQRQHKKYKLNSFPKPYGELPSPITIFNQMGPIQDAAIQTLCLQGFLDFDIESLMHGEIQLSELGIPEALTASISLRNEKEASLIEYLIEVLLPIPLDGPKGLKARTGLMEYRYDYA
ncbi:ABC-three component system middle component 5 [Thalassospira profundimaris]|uniref:Uncharacterized protein n=1 Tax=Thalassospira profundimaris TaxID=502049 RepID=A0A367WVL1_9PROT|nr:ABC-three component system middle component 5 [Thalassospira profundimaris]RCK45506.1 hypothetical protein TH30_13095 [Thalassospira profundimaris]